MLYCGNYTLERLVFHPEDNVEISYFIDISIGKDSPTFKITCSEDEEWMWQFWYNKTNYDIIKYLVLQSIMECDDVDEVIAVLDDTLAEQCADMVCADVVECDGDCENCEYDCE